MKSNRVSRKWKLVLLIILISVIGTFIPPILSQWVFKDNTTLVILTGGNFVTLISLVVSAYFGFNVWQKKVTEDPEKVSGPQKLTGDSGVKNEEGEA